PTRGVGARMSTTRRPVVDFPGSWELALPVLRDVVDASNARRIAVIGDVADDALTAWAADVGADVVAMPAPDADADRVPDADCYVVDRAPNHGGASQLLNAVVPGATRRGAVVVVRHVAWPAGRRDHYPCPTRLPDGVAHPYTTTFGVRPSAGD